MYIIDATTGKLMSMRTVDAGGGVLSLAVHPSGKFAYVANYDSHSISIYMIDAVTRT